MTDQPDNRKYLSIYPRDHLAAAVGGLELTQRLRENKRDSELGSELEALLVEIDADRQILEGVMEQLGVEPSNLKTAAAWFGEKLARLKLNGNIVRRSPLSRVVELEGLVMGVEGKRGLWESLDASPVATEFSEFDFPGLIERAEDQLDRLRTLHREAAAEVFAADPSERGAAAPSPRARGPETG